MGQGAAQAIEDAAALGALLPIGTAPEDIPRRLQLYEQCRKERADFVQDFTRQRGRDGGRGQSKSKIPILSSSVLMSESGEVASVLQKCISHNAWEHAVRVLQGDAGQETGFHPEARI